MNVSTSIATIQPEPETLEAHNRAINPDDGISYDKNKEKAGSQVAELHRGDDDPSLQGLNPSTLKDENYYPEGGLRAWLVVFGSFVSMVASFGIINTIGTFQAYLSAHQLRGYNQSTVGWVFSLFLFLTFFCGVQIGPIFDAKGPRVLILVGSVLLITSLMLLGLCTEYWHFIIVFGIVGGTGSAFIFVPAVSAIGHFFFIGRGNATGIATTGGSVGGVIFPLMLEKLFPKLGFAWSTRVMGFVSLFLLTIGNVLIRSRLPPKTGGSILPDLRIFRNVPFALTTTGVFFFELGLFIPISYLSSFALAHGFSTTFSYRILAVLNAGSFFGRWFPGYIADRIGRFNTMILTLILCLISILALWLPAATSTPLIVLFAILFGFGSGSNIGLAPVCIGQMCQTEEYGRYCATCYTIVSFGSLIGLPIAGHILSSNQGGYRGLIIFTGASYIASLVFFVAARVLLAGWNPRSIS